MYRNDHAQMGSRHILHPIRQFFLVLSLFTAGLLGAQSQGQTLYSIGDPTDEEQLYLEYLNRTRAFPVQEAQIFYNTTDTDVLNAFNYFNVDLDLMVSQYNSIAPVPPLSLNVSLSAAARAHSLDMLTNAFQGHTGTGGTSPGNRLSSAGYAWQTYGENVYASAKSVFHGHAGFEVDWGYGTGGMQTPAGHRNNIHSANFREVGIGVVNGSNPGVGPQLVTQDLASQFNPKPFITGVAYYDLNGNGSYDAGEGLGGIQVTVAPSDFYAVTARSGGYSVPVAGNGNYAVTFAGSDLSPLVLQRDVSNLENIKIDFSPTYVPPSLSGPANPVVNQPNGFTFTAVGGATGYMWKQSLLTPFTHIEGAENGLTPSLTSAISGGYDLIANNLQSSGNASFHFVHADPAEQSLTINKRIRVSGTSELTFASRLRYATATQVARAQVSVDEGANWTDVWSRNGTSDSGQTAFESVAASLSAFAGEEVMIRMVYDFSGGSYYTGSGSNVGWYVDEIAVSDAEELTATEEQAVSTGTSFSFEPSTDAQFSLSVRANVSGRLLPWGPAMLVNATHTAPSLPVMTITTLPIVTNGSVEFEFNLTGNVPNTFQIEAAPTPLGPWTLDPTASVEPTGQPDQYRVNASLGADNACFYRIVTN